MKNSFGKMLMLFIYVVSILFVSFNLSFFKFK